MPLSEAARRTPLLAETEVLVLGGGPAGIAAAASAAAAGREVLLVERYGFLGGMGTAAGVTNFCGLHAKVHGEMRRVVHGVADELLQRIAALGGLNEPHAIFGRTLAQAYDGAAYKCAADELLLARGVRLLFHAQAAGVAMRDPEHIDALLVETRSGRRALRARIFIDCSGDGELMHWAGAPWQQGDEHGELLYPTLMFRVAGVDDARAGEAWREVGPRMAEAQRAGRHRFARQGAILRPMKHAGEWRVNVTQIANAQGRAMDGTDALQLSAGEIEGRRQVREFFAFLRAEMPGFENAYLLEIAPQVGIRETRRLLGRLVLQAEHVLGCADFDDAIGVNAWPLEQHVAGGVKWSWPPAASRGWNQLPWRMLLPQRVHNLLVAGRCASMSSAAQSAARVSGACFVMGEAAGLGAALALRAGGAVGDIGAAALQRGLLAQGAWLGSNEHTRSM
ncbi:MAG TPA: FAD-dependent oxidoreductase [Rubrivivax sp.]|nr:FAD-dependent oxidoreductase [Rubrivivax sp.]